MLYYLFRFHPVGQVNVLNACTAVSLGTVICKYVINGYMFRPFAVTFTEVCGPGSSIGIATGYGLHGPVIESR